MLNYILYNKYLDTLLLILACINIILNNNINIDIPKKEKKSKNDIEKFKRNIILFYGTLLSIFLFFILNKYHTIYALIIIFATLKSIYDIYVNIKFDSTNLSITSKRMYTFATFLIFIFLSSNSSNIYIKNFSFLNHTAKESLLLIYLIIKTMTYLFLLLINFSIVISNIKIIFNKRLMKIIPKMDSISNKRVEINLYNFYFYKKYNSNLSLMIDKIIYVISFPIYLIIIIILYLVINIFRFFIKFILKILRTLSNYDDNRDKIIKQILRIALIISLIIVYAITIYNKHIFSSEIIELYNLITTVILIPIIYDGIKSKKQI